MDTLVHADIFFFISSIMLVVLGVLLAIGLFYTIGIVRDVREVSARLRKASADIEKDLEALRTNVKAEGNKVRGMADLILGFALRKLTPKRTPRKKTADVETEEEA